MVYRQQRKGLNQLGLDGRSPHRHHRLPGKNGSTLRNGIEISGKAEVRQELEKLLRKKLLAPKEFDILSAEVQVLDIVDQLGQSRADGEAALVGHIPEKHIKIGNTILISRLKITISHGQLIKIAEHGHVQFLFCFHLTPQNKSKVGCYFLDYKRRRREKQSFSKIFVKELSNFIDFLPPSPYSKGCRQAPERPANPNIRTERTEVLMDVILGIDIGGSTTKIVGLRTDGSVISMLRVRAEDQVTSLYGALGNYLTSNGLSLENIRRVVLTGVGASFVDGNIYGLPTCKVDEFRASGTGALALSGQESAVVVTMGTGTAFLSAERSGAVRHLCGSGIGGGTLGGLCHKLVGMERFGQIKKLASCGDLNQVDLTIRDISKTVAPTLDPNMTAANFGNLAEDASPADLAAGAVNLVLQAIGTMTVLACQGCGASTVVLTGSMTTLDQVGPNFRFFEELYGIHYIIPENATFATAIGAGLCSLQEKAVK